MMPLPPGFALGSTARLAAAVAAVGMLALAWQQPLGAGGGDPTEPPAPRQPAAAGDPEAEPEAAQEPDPPEVRMVRLRGDQRMALINGRWIHEGQRVDVFELRRVGAHSVDLFADETRYRIPVVGHRIEKRLRDSTQHPDKGTKP